MNPLRKIIYLSPPAPVSMADKWFEIANIDHFWIRRRFDVFQRMWASLVGDAREIAEIGCGHGLLQRQIEDAFGVLVKGFDLNEIALKQNVSRNSPVLCYNIYEKNLELQNRFDLVFLFDVLEHIAEEGPFIEAIRFHLAPKGRLIVNVPAGQWAFSSYDRAAGHVRRYSIKRLRDAFVPHGMTIPEWTYWGLPLTPALLLRKVWLAGEHDNDEIISKGFDSRMRFFDRLLYAISRCEPLPQKLLGSSLMAVVEAE